MSLENAEENLKEFGKELNLDNLAFDENNTCILGIDNTFSLHLTYEPNSDRLYLYSPILDGLPQDTNVRLTLYEALLEGSMLGGQMAGGGVGVATKEELILMHCVLEMANAEPVTLRKFAPLFVECVERWREVGTKIMEGRYDKVRDKPVFPGQRPGGGMPGGAAPGGAAPAGGAAPGSKPSGGEGFIKI